MKSKPSTVSMFEQLVEERATMYVLLPSGSYEITTREGLYIVTQSGPTLEVIKRDRTSDKRF